VKAVILCGGKGARLKPYTKVFPKPLMPVGDEPILEIIIRQLKIFNITDIILAVGHMSKFIKTYFGDGSFYGVKIKYSQEDRPCGTAGPLTLIKDDLNKTFLMTNGDILSATDYDAMLNFHKDNNATATVGLNRREVLIDFGVIDITEENDIVNYTEKPTLNYLISMGTYIFEPEILEYIPNGKKFDLPDLIKELIRKKKSVKGFVSHNYWLDIGRAEDYERANTESEKIKDEIFKRR
jgi:NDP-sugar pyrophosphorylase family protein